MTTLSHQPGAEGQMNPDDCRSITLLTILSKLVMALVIGIVTTVVLIMD